MKLIVGLGNIGKEYHNTKHNIGFEVLDEYLPNIKWSTNKFGDYYKLNDVIFLKPSTYMNLSGNAVKYFLDYYKISINDILIIQDDMDLELGQLKLKKKSTAGGHNGIKSIINMLGTNDFLRLKIGISKSNFIDSSKYVLSVFTKTEKELIFSNNATINNIITDFIQNKNAEQLMNLYN